MASKLDKALSLTKQDKLKSPFKFADSSGGKLKAGGGGSRYLPSHEALPSKEEKKSLAKNLGLSLKSTKEGKTCGVGFCCVAGVSGFLEMVVEMGQVLLVGGR